MGSNLSSSFLPYSFFAHSTIYLHFWHFLEPYLFLEPSFFIILFILVNFTPAGHKYASSFGRYLKLYFLNLCFLASGVFLDFDKNYFPVNLEILSVSKRLNVEKEFLISPDGDVNITISSDLINLNVVFRNDDEEHFLKFVNRHAENLKITDCETIFALV